MMNENILTNKKIKKLFLWMDKKVFIRNLFIVALGVFFFILRYQSPWITLIILMPFFYFTQKNNKLSSFLSGGIIAGVIYVFIEYSFLKNISISTYIGSMAIYGVFYFFTPSFILLFIAKKFSHYYQGFLYAMALTIGFWLYNFSFLHYPLLSPLDGLTQYPFFLQLLNLVGEYGGIFLVGLINFYLLILIENVFKKKSERKDILKNLIYIVGIILIVILYGFYSEYKFKKIQDYSNKEKKIILIQGNLQGETNKSEYEKYVNNYKNKYNFLMAPSMYYFEVEKLIKLTEQALKEEKHPDLIVWPEKGDSAPMFKESGDGSLMAYDSNWIKKIFAFSQKINIPIVYSGLVESFNNDKDAYNVVALINGNDKVMQFYYKKKLFFFGENIPVYLNFLKKFKKRDWNYNIISQESEQRQKKFFRLKDMKFGVVVCFENGFSYLSREAKEQGVNFMINSSNDTLFQSAKELNYQETTTVFRAIENGTYYVRATNVGKTEVVDPVGRIVMSIKPFKEEFLIAKIKNENKKTFFDKEGFKVIHIIIVVYILVVLYNLINNNLILINKK